jgi:hypothetical protein
VVKSPSVVVLGRECRGLSSCSARIKPDLASTDHLRWRGLSCPTIPRLRPRRPMTKPGRAWRKRSTRGTGVFVPACRQDGNPPWGPARRSPRQNSHGSSRRAGTPSVCVQDTQGGRSFQTLWASRASGCQQRECSRLGHNTRHRSLLSQSDMYRSMVPGHDGTCLCHDPPERRSCRVG